LANIRNQKQVFTKNNSRASNLAKSANKAKTPSGMPYGELCREKDEG
jgi:hypothetical protein